MPENLVVIPTYNEKENIDRMVKTILSLEVPFNILIVDDGSPDGTASIVQQLQNDYPTQLHLIMRPGKQGLGTAYIQGFKWALERDYQYVFEMDCDFSHNPHDLIRLYKTCSKEGFDLSIGSRYIKGGKIVNWPLNRILMSYFASLYVRMVLQINIKDTTAGFKCYKRKVLETIDLNNNRFIGYAFQIEMKYKTWKHGFAIKEVPITFTDRIEGVSKMSTDIFREAFLGVIQMRKF